MKKITQKFENGATGVLYAVEKRKIFTEDFKAIIRSLITAQLLGVYDEYDNEDVDSQKLTEQVMAQTTRDVERLVAKAIPLLMLDCSFELVSEGGFEKEMRDLGFGDEEDGNA